MQLRTEILDERHARLTIDFERASLRTLTLLLFVVLWIYTAMSTLPLTYWTPGNSLDGSHAFGSNYFPNAGFRYGTDLTFTFGPLGFLIYPENIGNHVAVANVLRTVIWLILLSHLVLLYRAGANGILKSIILMLAIVPARNLLLGSFDYYALAVSLVLILYLIERPRAWPAFASLIFIAGILALTKFTSYLMALTCAGLLVAARDTRRNKVLALAAVLALPVAFFLHNPSLTGLFNYVYGAFELAAGYNEAMSLPTRSADAVYAAVVAAMFLLGLIYAVAKRQLGWRAAVVLLLLYWLNFKHGFVRSDDHPPIAFCFEIVIAAVLICLIRYPSRLVRQYLAGFPLFVLLALAGTNEHWRVWTPGFWSTANTREMASELVHWEATEKRIDDEIVKTDEFQQLPEIFRTRLEGSTALVYPWELAYARSGHFKLEPLYTMQAYSAYTEYLDRKTAEHIQAGRDRASYVLMDWHTIDERHPLLDAPTTWAALVANYELDSIANGRVLLKRRPAPIHHDARLVQEVPLPIGQWVDLPAAQAELWAKIRIPYSAFGALRKAAFKANAVFLTLQSRERTGRFRIVPGVLLSAFPLNSFPMDFESFVNILQTGEVNAPVLRVRLDTASPNHYCEPSLQLLQEAESEITFDNGSSKSFVNEFHLASPSEILKISAGSIDLINDQRNPASIPDREHPLPITNGTGLTLEGWLADKPDGRPFDDVYAVVNGRLFRASTQGRPDVGAFFKNPALDRSGFRVQIASEDLEKGLQSVDLIGVQKQSQTAYRFSKSLYAERK